MNKFSAEVRRLAKRANQRMVELEQHNINSPAYKAVQATLEMMGRRAKNAFGRRFSETGKGTENELRQQKAALEKFLNKQTSTVRGYNKALNDMYKTADKKYGLSDAGITKEDYMNLWESLPDKEKDRMYYATFYIQILQTYEMKRESGKIRPENEMTLTDIIRELQGSTSLKAALKNIGLTVSDIRETTKKLYK